MTRDHQAKAADASDVCGEVLERLEVIEDRIEDLQRLADLQLEGTADIKTHLRKAGGPEKAA